MVTYRLGIYEFLGVFRVRWVGIRLPRHRKDLSHVQNAVRCLGGNGGLHAAHWTSVDSSRSFKLGRSDVLRVSLSSMQLGVEGECVLTICASYGHAGWGRSCVFSGNRSVRVAILVVWSEDGAVLRKMMRQLV